MKHFKFYTKKDIAALTGKRKFETKLGERIKLLKTDGEWPEVIQQSTAKYVLLGIPENIGVKANYGIAGTDTAWQSFISCFLNIQSNDFLSGDDILLLGHFDFGDIQYLIENNAGNKEELISAYRHAVDSIDEEVENMLKAIATAKKIPIIIGGGHNNAYPIIKGVAKGLYKTSNTASAQINCINLDAHTDYRTTEGRHSGNAFRYAAEDGYLGKYSIIGIHENYMPQNILMDIHNNELIDYISYEEIFIHERKSFKQAIADAAAFTEDAYTGIELDMDSIENVLSSAVSPSGITVLNARQYITYVLKDIKPAYLHISEGATQLADGRKCDTTGKLISYLVSDFIKGNERTGK